MPRKLIDISIPLRFDGPQPNAFGVEPATARSLGDTRHGYSVNFDAITFVPHCNGTHTECVGHITDERISVRDCLTDVLIPAVLVSVEPVLLGQRATFDFLEPEPGGRYRLLYSAGRLSRRDD